MRPLDEVLGSFSSQGPAARRYLLRKLERMPITLDAATPLALLHQAEDSDVGDYARLAEDAFWGRRHEDRIRRAGGDHSQEVGDWTRFLGSAEPAKPADVGVHLERAAAYKLAALVNPLSRQLEQGGKRAVAAFRVLARIRIPASLDAIVAASASGPNAPLSMAALSVFGGEAAAKRALELLKSKAGTPVVAGMIPALRNLPGKEAFEFLRAQLEAGPKLAGAVGSALEGFQAFECQPLLDKVIGSGDAWAAVQAIETMGRLGGAQVVARLAAIFSRLEHPMARVVCLQALGETGTAEAGPVALAALGNPDPVVQAAAVEALIRLPVPPAEYAERVYPLVDSTHAKLALNASLACALLDPSRAARRVKELLGSGSPALLLQGIHCLAYLDYPASAAILAQVVRKAPAGPLRLQAVRALGRRAADDPQAAPPLFALLESDDPAVRLSAAWFTAGCHPIARKAGGKVLAAQLAKEPDAAVRPVLAEALGLAGPDALDQAPVLHKAALEGGPVAAAAAWSLAAWGGPMAGLDQLAKSKSPAIRARAIVGRWYSDGEGLEDLALLLSARDETDILEAAGAAREAAESAVVLGEARRLAGLAGRLTSVLESTGFSLRREALDPAAVALPAKLAVEPGVVLPELQSSGRRPKDLRVQGMDRVKLKLAVKRGMAPPRLPDEDEAAQVLQAARRAAPQEVDRAVAQATYYQEGVDPSGIGTPQAGPRLRWWLIWIVYILGAVALGRIIRAFYDGTL